MTSSAPRSPADGPAASAPAADPAAHRPWLAENRLFQGVPAETLEELIEVPELVAFGAGDVLFDEGHEGDFLYLLASGAVRVSKRGRAGRQETLSHFTPGDFFGEMALLDLEPRSARAVVVRPAVLGRVDRAGFERMLRMAPGRISANLTHGIVGRLRSANDQFITELTRAERLSLIGSMSAMVAHDFKNPMSAILMAADLISETSPSPDHAESAAVIRRAVTQMVAMTEELLDFARGTPCLRTETVTVDDLLSDLDDQVLGRLRRDGIRVHRQVQWSGELRADRRRLSRALCNVARNAAEAMPDGGDFTLAVEERPGGRVAFVFSDTGYGIPEEVLPTLFEPFISYGKPGGTGLGMAIARSVSEAHGGSIGVSSVPGQGTTVEIILPLSGPSVLP